MHKIIIFTQNPLFCTAVFSFDLFECYFYALGFPLDFGGFYTYALCSLMGVIWWAAHMSDQRWNTRYEPFVKVIIYCFCIVFYMNFLISHYKDSQVRQKSLIISKNV